ncbi:hypothetical protein GCM10009574_035870 [Streptomyces asiaticus]|uniref:Uncharacterized protein n=1 Tax=Streptomyces rhizosphaericus TaxID=114699 RepID=A0ABN1PP56_9ACTN
MEVAGFIRTQSQRAGKRGHDVPRWAQGPALFKTEKVVRGYSGQQSKLFAAQTGGASPSGGGQSNVLSRDAGTPCAQRVTQRALWTTHGPIVVDPAVDTMGLPFLG